MKKRIKARNIEQTCLKNNKLLNEQTNKPKTGLNIFKINNK